MILKKIKFMKNAIRYYTNGLVGVIGVPYCKGQTKPGVDCGPKVLRQHGLIGSLETISANLKIKDYGDISYNVEKFNDISNMLNFSDFICCSQVLSNKVHDVLAENDKVLVLGGDHSIGFGSIAGHLAYDPNISLIWIDAHADINLNKSSPSGNIHGMPVSMLVNELQSNWTNTNIQKLMKNYISANKIYYIGLRDVDSYESYLLKYLGIHAYGMNVIDQLGIPKVLEQILDSINPTDNLHISFDIDALDIKEAPSTGTAVTGGLTLREGLITVETLAQTNRIKGFDLVEINPNIGSEKDVNKTVSAGIKIIKAAFGYDRSGMPKNFFE